MRKLTEREKQVQKLLIAGKTYAQIAQELFISKTTVKKYVCSIYKKLNVANRVELILQKKES